MHFVNIALRDDELAKHCISITIVPILNSFLVLYLHRYYGGLPSISVFIPLQVIPSFDAYSNMPLANDLFVLFYHTHKLTLSLNCPSGYRESLIL